MYTEGEPTPTPGPRRSARLGNWALNALIAGACFSVIYGQIAPRLSTPPKPPGTVGKGDLISTGRDQPAGPSIVLVTASTCHFCSESMPFYKRLVQMTEREGIPLVTIAAGADTAEMNRAYFAQHGIALEREPVVAKDISFKVQYTPTLFLVKGKTVIATQEGKFATTRLEDEFMIQAAKLKRGELDTSGRSGFLKWW